jgi:hypothetical protein
LWGPILPLPRFAKIHGFLPDDAHRQLLDWAISAHEDFHPAEVSQQGRVDPARRIALTTRKLGNFEASLRERLLEVLPRLMAETGRGDPCRTHWNLSWRHTVMALILRLTLIRSSAGIAAHEP